MVRLAERQRLIRRGEYERMVDSGLFRGEHVSPTAFPDVEVVVSDVVGDGSGRGGD